MFLDMVNEASGASSAELGKLQALTAEYEAANGQLKAAEAWLLDENKRLNLLLRGLRNADVSTARPDAAKIKKSLSGMIDDVKGLQQSLMQLADDPQGLERIYKLRAASALTKRPGIAARGLYGRLALWMLKRSARRNPALRKLLELQDMVAAQNGVIESWGAELRESVEGIRKTVGQVAESVELATGAMAPQDLYEEAIAQLKKAHFSQVDAAAVKEALQEVEKLRRENEKLADAAGADALKIEKKEEKNARLKAENQELKEQVKAVAAHLKQTHFALPYNWKAIANSRVAPAEPQPAAPDTSALTAKAGFLQQENERQRAEIEKLQGRLGQAAASSLLAPEDEKLAQNAALFIPALEEAVQQLKEARAAAAAAPPPKAGVGAFFGKLAFWRRKNKAQAVSEAVAALDESIGRAESLIRLIPDLTQKFNGAVETGRRDLQQEIDRYVRESSKQVQAFRASQRA
jgi:regulator of replication initiation timing